MARNRIEMSQDIFRKIQAAALASDPHFPDDGHSRWIKRESLDDANLMAEATVTILPLGVNMLAASIDYKAERYFCFVGLPCPEEPPTGLEAVNATPGLFASLVVAADIPASATAAKVRDVIEGAHRDVPGYEGHSLIEIMELFPRLSFYRSINSSDEVYLSQLERVSGSYCARGYNGFPLPLGSQTIHSLIDLFENGPETVPYQLPLRGILSYNFASFFLDMYRCLEQLYSAPKLGSLSAKIRHDGSLADLASVLENILSWRPKEEESLCALLRDVSSNSREAISVAIGGNKGTISDPTAEKCASLIYRLRNSHVHFRPAMKAENIPDWQWEAIVSAMCRVVIEVYVEFGIRFLQERRA